MNSVLRILSNFCILLLLSNSAAWSADLPNSYPPLAVRTLTATSGVWDGILDSHDRLWIAVYTSRHQLILEDPQGSKIPVTSNNQSIPSGLAVATGKQGHIWLAYSEKSPPRGIFVTRSDALNQVYKVSGATSPLSRIQLEADGHGGVYVLWYDESRLPEQPQQAYWLWINHLDQNGQIGTPQRLLPGIYPQWLHDQAGHIAVFSWYGDAQGRRVAVRVRNPSGDFGPAITVAQVAHFSPPFGAFTSGKRWFVYWQAQYGTLMDDFLIEGAYSDDQGSTWQTFNIDALRKLDVRSIEMATDHTGHVAMAITGRYPHPQPGQTEKFSAYLVTSADNGSTWSKPLHLRTTQADYSQAPNAKVAFIGQAQDSRLLVAVEDWRTIRSSIRYWLSAVSNISNWQVQDQLLRLDPTFNYQFNYSNNTIYTQHDKATFLIERLGDDLIQRTIIAYTAPTSDLLTPTVVNELVPDLESLKNQVNAYGRTLIARDYQASYEFFDPFYRARIDMLGHLQNQGRIAYQTAEFVDAQVQGHLATVQFHIVASVPPFKGASGEILQSPTRDVIFPIHWLWINGKWYMEYYSEARDIRYTRY